MKHRSPVAVLLLPLITFGIYGIVWFVKTKNEMNAKGSDIPTAWLIIIPFVNLWWMWKYSEGVDKTTSSQLSTVISFILLFLLGSIGMAIIQNEFNKLSEAAVPTPTPATPSPTTPPIV